MPSLREAGLRHIRHYTERARQAGERFSSGKQPEGLALFDQDREQIDRGWQWLQQQRPTDTTDTILLHLVNALIFISSLRQDPRREHIPQLEALLAAARRLNDRFAEGATLGNLGVVYNDLADYPRAIAYYEQALHIRREVGDRRGEGQDLGNLGLVYRHLGNYPQAIAYCEQQLAIAREVDDRRAEAHVLGNLGIIYADLGDYQKAVDYHTQALHIS
jgi:tetratricopeptide (TPR) repeat protein